MKYLAINTVAKTEVLLHAGSDFYFSSLEKSVASTELLPKIDKLLDSADVKLQDLDFLACVIGPGSFTGIRIGVSAVRAIGYALKLKVLPVIYFDVLAYNTIAPFTAVVDGTGGVCYIKNYLAPACTSALNPPQSLSPHLLCIKTCDIKHYAKGEIISDKVFTDAITRTVEDGFLPLKNAVESAAARNEFVSCEKLEPLYLRRSQPEREKGEL